MYFDDPRKVATLIASRRRTNDEPQSTTIHVKPEVMKQPSGEVDGRHTAMEDFMAAHKEGSPMKMAEALKNFIDIHAAQKEVDESKE